MDFADEFCHHILATATHPVITRFWLFGDCVRRMLTLTMLFNASGETIVLDFVYPLTQQHPYPIEFPSTHGGSANLEALPAQL